MTATSTRRRRGRIAGLLAAGAMALLLIGSGPSASAHAGLVGSDPADGSVLPTAPEQVTLTFNEPMTLPPDGIEVFGPEGDPVAASAGPRDVRVVVDFEEVLAAGTHLVAWRVVSADGHLVTGLLTFSIGSPSPSPVAPDVDPASGALVGRVLAANQTLLYIGLFLGGGLAIYGAWILPTGPTLAKVRRRLRRPVWGAAAIAAGAALASLPLTLVHQQGGSLGAVFTASLWSGIVPGAAVSTALLLTGLALVGVSRSGRVASVAAPRVLSGVGVGLAATGLSLTGHTRGTDLAGLVMATDVAHVLAGSVWLGGLVGLALTLRSLSGQPAAASRALARFSGAAATSLVVLLASGALLSWRLIGTWSNLFHSQYGLLLLAKVSFVGIAVSIAAWNRFALVPRISARSADASVAGRRLSRTVLVEAALLVGSLAVTGVLVSSS